MPKRDKTPPPPDDEPKYLTIAHPYPLHANLELSQDLIDCALWLACFVGKDYLYALFYRPSAPNMIIAEVSRSFTGWSDVLGEHRWSEMLRAPASEEIGHASKIFYCTYKDGREVQKYGWRRIYVKEEWFSKWSPNNSKISYPYPKTYYCETPVEDRTNAPFCRPLPRPKRLPVSIAPAPVVGSAGWVNAKAINSLPVARGAWARGASVKRGAGRGRGATPSPSSAAAAAKVENPWNTVAPSFDIPTGNNTNAVTSPPSLTVVPPGIGSIPMVPALTYGTDDSSNSSAGPSSPSSAVPMSPSFEAALYGLSLDSEPGDPEAYMGAWDEEDVASLCGTESSMGWGGAGWSDSGKGQGKGKSKPKEQETITSEWGTWTIREPPKPEPQCPVHGTTCKKGICIEARKMQSKIDRENRMREEAEQKAGRGGKKGVRGREKSANPRGAPAVKRPAVIATDGGHGWGSAPKPATGWGPGTPKTAANNIKATSTAIATAASTATSAAAGGDEDEEDDEDDMFSTVSSNRTSRRRAPSVSSVAPSSDGWGNVSNGPW